MNYKDNILYGDALEQLKTIPDQTAQMCVTSPPYWGLRDYGVDGQLGLEETPEEYVSRMTNIFREVRRVLKDDGTLWLNIGDSYCGGGRGGNEKTHKGSENMPDSKVPNGLKPKDLCMVPARVAMSLQSDGWYLRSDIIWHKPNPMPESVKDRPTKAHEYIFLLSKSEQYYYDWEAIREKSVTPKGKHRGGSLHRSSDNAWPGHNTNSKPISDGYINKRTVWDIATKPYPEAHFAVYPPDLIAPCIKAGSKPYDIVLDPFFGSGTTGEVCQKLNRHYLGVELNEDYAPLQQKRLSQPTFKFKCKTPTK